MATLTIRKVDDGVRDRLKERAQRSGRSMEAEAREILAAAVETSPRLSLYELMRSWEPIELPWDNIQDQIPPIGEEIF